MKIHLFKIEQFFKEQLVLNAELQYPFAKIKMKDVGFNKIRCQVDHATSELKLDASHEYITDLSCSCNSYNENKQCIHLIMSAWEIRKQGYPEKKSGQFGRSRHQFSNIISEIDEKNLRQFLLGYTRRNQEFKLVIKLLFSHEVDHSMPYEEIKKQLYDLFELYRPSLDTKKHQKTFDFYLRTYLGVAEDLIAKKDYRSGGFYALSSWELWMDKQFQMMKITDAKANYEQVLNVLGRIERSPISPELYKYIFKSISVKLQNEDANPILKHDLPELMMDWDEFSEQEYTDLILRKIAQPRNTEYWISRFFNNIDLYSSEQLDFAKQYLERLGIDKVIRKLQGDNVKLDDHSFFYIIGLEGNFNKSYVRRLQHLIVDEFKFLAFLHLLVKYGEHANMQSLLYQTTYTNAGMKALEYYLDSNKVPTWIRILIRHHLFDQENVFERLENIDEPKEWIHLLTHLKADQQKVVLQKVKDYCLNFAANHIGTRSKQHLQSIGQLLSQNGFEKEWAKIREEIVSNFDHRQSIQSMENPFL